MFAYFNDIQRYIDFCQETKNVAANWQAGDYKNSCLWCRHAMVVGIKKFLQDKRLQFLDVEDLLYFANKSALKQHIWNTMFFPKTGL